MSQINFPNNPTNGESFVAGNGTTYQYDSSTGQWKVLYSPGPIGPRGAEGPEGPAGPVGPQGATGPQGSTGAEGLEGPAGPVGPQGATGPQGSTGAEGLEGPAGPVGPQGDEGPQGATGVFSTGQDATIGTLTVTQIDIAADLDITDGSTTKYTFARTSGDFTATGNVTAYSDISLKENIEEIPEALEKVSSIRGVTYDRKDIEGPRQSGVIAQEVEAVLPEVVLTDEKGVKSVAYGNLVGLLVEAIKELRAEVETLKEDRN